MSEYVLIVCTLLFSYILASLDIYCVERWQKPILFRLYISRHTHIGLLVKLFLQFICKCQHLITG